MSETSPRPRAVTVAGWLMMVGSVLVVLTVFERIQGMGSLETRETAEEMLSGTSGTGLSVEGLLRLLEVAAMVAGGCAAAMAVLGFHVLRRSKGARLAATILALPLFVTGTVSGAFPLSWAVACGAILLWVEPARDWFEGRAPRPAPTRPEPPVAPERSSSAPDPSWPPPPPPAAPPAGPPAAEGPRAHPGFGAAPAPPHTWATQVQQRPAPATRATQRPGAVLWACVLTWVFSAMATLLMGMSALVVATAPDLVFDQLQQQQPDLMGEEGMSRGSVSAALYAVAAVAVVWSVVASVFAVLLVRRVPWARVALLASTGGVAAVSLVGLLNSGVLLLVPLMAAAVTISLLVRPEVRHWVSAL